MAEPSFEARPGFQASSLTFWIYVLGRINEKAHKIRPDTF